MGLATVGGVGFGAFTFATSEATAQTSGVTAGDVSIESNDGTVTELYADPVLDVTWDNFETEVHDIEATLWATLASESAWDSFGSKNVQVSSPGTSGSITIDVGQHSLLESDGGPIAAADLEDSTEGDGAEETDITVQARINFFAEDGSQIDPPLPAEKTTFTVSVTNLTATATVSGSFNTGGS